MTAELRITNRAPLAKDIQFGGGGLGGLFTVVSDEQADATLRKALELGMVQFDTAPLYGAGLSEERFGKILPGTNAEITTKCGRLVIDAADLAKYPESVIEKQMKEFWAFDGSDRLAKYGVILDYSAAAVRKSVEESRKRLGGMPIKCLRLHDAEDEERYEWATREGTIREMVRLREEGIIKEVSLGMNDAKYLMRHVLDHPAGTFDNIMVAGCWNLLDQSGYELLKVCQERGIKIHQAGVFGSGVLWGSSHLRYGAVPEEAAERVRRWEALCGRHNVRLPEAALAFAYLPDIVEYVCVGCKKPEHVETNLALCGHKVPQALWEDAKKEGLLPEWLPLPKDE